MGFRDDNEALRARAKAAEDRAARAETERERMERELAEAKANDEADAKRIAELEKRLARLEPSAAQPAMLRPRRAAILGVATSLVVGVGMVAFFLVQPKSEPAVPGFVPPGIPAAAPAAPQLPPAAPPEPVSPLERVRLAGVVRAATGVEGLEPGDGCVADLGLDGDFGGLEVRCAAGDIVRTVFDGTEPTGGGLTNVSDQIREARTVPGRVTRTMSYTLVGQWSGPQAQIQLDPDQRMLRIWRDGLGARGVLIHLESAAADRGTPTLDDAGGGTIARGTLARLVLEGDVPETLGELDTSDCSLRTEPQPRSGTLTVRLVVRCGERVLYGEGSSGWVPAPADGDVLGPVQDTHASATDTDPMMSYTRERLTLAEPDWRLAFAVEPHPRCTLAEGRWVGALRDVHGELVTGVSLTEGELTLPDGTVRTGTEDMRCHEGVARWTDDEGTTILEGRFGPRLTTFVGHLAATGELLELYRTD